MRDRDLKGRFIKGHKKAGGFAKGSKHREESKIRISESLEGSFGIKSRRWRGNNAGYVAKHLWIVKHYGKANKCQNVECGFDKPKRFEWASITDKPTRKRNDYIMLCCSCHRKYDMGLIGITLEEVSL